MYHHKAETALELSVREGNCHNFTDTRTKSLGFVIMKDKLTQPSACLPFRAHQRQGSRCSSFWQSVENAGDELHICPQTSTPAPKANLSDQVEGKQGCRGLPALPCATHCVLLAQMQLGMD